MNEQSKPSQESSRSQANILDMDDDEMNPDLHSRRLIKKGFHEDVAEDSFEVLDWIDNNPCDLILLDIMMPGMSGIDVLEKIRETRDGTELPIIMATAKDTRDDIVGGMHDCNEAGDDTGQ